jgi:LysM repeat protein
MAYTTYTVESGDSLSKIAKANKTTVSALLEANPKLTTDPKYKNGSVIFSGTKIRIPIPETKTTTPTPTPTPTPKPTPTPTPTQSFSPADFRRAEEASMQTVTSTPTTPTQSFSPADFRRADEASMQTITSTPITPTPVPSYTPPPIVDERTQLAAKGYIPPYYEFSNGYLFYSGTPYTGNYLGVEYVNGLAKQVSFTPPPVEPQPPSIPNIPVPSFNEIPERAKITTETEKAQPQLPALPAPAAMAEAKPTPPAQPAPPPIDTSYLIAYGEALARANALRGKAGLTRNLALEKARANKELGVTEAENALYNARLKALASLSQRGLYGATGLKLAAQDVAGLEPIRARTEALRQFAEQTNLASRMFEEEQAEATEIEKQASLAKLKAEELATKLTKAGV